MIYDWVEGLERMVAVVSADVVSRARHNRYRGEKNPAQLKTLIIAAKYDSLSRTSSLTFVRGRKRATINDALLSWLSRVIQLPFISEV